MVDPKESKGARLEWAAFRNRLRKMIKSAEYVSDRSLLQRELDWVLSRQKKVKK